ncbi:MAG: ATP-dependent DNA helicase RecG [Thermoguttaceae bacterium]
MAPLPTDPLRAPVTFLRGVGPERAELLHRLGIHWAFELLFYFPRDYQDMTDRRSVDKLEEGKKIQTISGVIEEWSSRETRNGKMLTLVVDGSRPDGGGGYVKALWFNMPYIQYEFAKGRRLLLTGKPKFDYPFWIMSHPTITYLMDEEDEGNFPPFLPIYPLTDGLKQHNLRRILRELVTTHAPFLEEVFPSEFLKQNRLLPISKAIAAIHFPKSQEELSEARRRFIYQEFFVLQLGLAIRRLQHQTHFKSTPIEGDATINARIRSRFPFVLTKGQEQAISDICADMRRPIPMNRLLQGDVGSGKTVVALYAMLLCVARGHQAVFMAPTEILARQHLRTFQRLLEGSQVHIAPVFGGQKANERASIFQAISTGDAKIIVGTQAIIHNDIPFHKLGLVVIDEQHKFGVMQRAALKSSDRFDPHYLVMTATPIPRSVTMTLFGDLDLSVMHELPPGRQKVKTYLADSEQRTQWWDFVARKIRQEKWQGYVVVPLVEESDNFDAKSLQEVHAHLSTGPLRDFRLGTLHGRMSSDEKERVMFDFRTGAIDVLIATTVIEVGVDVPNANLLTIENGERFGLSQLHQLRGRIGRGKNPGFCTVFYQADATKEDTQKRLKAFAGTTNGFKLAEKDLSLRGSGDLFGTQQHGMPPFRIADIVRDVEILNEARKNASEMVQIDPGLALDEHAKLRRQMLARYGHVLDLGDVG